MTKEAPNSYKFDDEIPIDPDLDQEEYEVVPVGKLCPPPRGQVKEKIARKGIGDSNRIKPRSRL